MLHTLLLVLKRLFLTSMYSSLRNSYFIFCNFYIFFINFSIVNSFIFKFIILNFVMQGPSICLDLTSLVADWVVNEHASLRRFHCFFFLQVISGTRVDYESH